MTRDRRHYILLPLVALIAGLPLILRGCSCGHDFDFHIINWFEAAKQFSHGTLHPHWAYTPAWNAGEPRFVFYPPLSWTIGALLGLLMPWTWTPVAYTWLALTAAGFALHYAVRNYATSNAALVAAAIYITNPYTLYTAYERTAYAELLAATWLPLLLYGILRERVGVPDIAIPVALLWLTNAPAAVMGCYALALVAIVRLVLSSESEPQSRPSLVANTTAGALLGLGLASFYVIPAAYERRFVQIDFAILPGLRPQDNFLFHYTTDPEHNAVLRTASSIAILLLILTLASLFAAIAKARMHPSSHREGLDKKDVPYFVLIALAILGVGIAFMLIPLSAPLWRYLPELRFLQFPWRLTAILAVVFALSTAMALPNKRLKPAHAVLLTLLVACALAIPADVAFQQRCYPEDTLPQRLAIFRSANPGTDPTDEYTPNTADNDSLVQTNPGYWLAEDASATAPKDPAPGAAPHVLDLSLTVPQTLILNLRDYPVWRVTINGSAVGTRLHRDDGLIALPLPAGGSHIEIASTTLTDQRIGYLVSAFSMLCLTGIFARRSRTIVADSWNA